MQIIAENRKARHIYETEDKLEAGIMLLGSEVKSLRAKHIILGPAYAVEKADGFYLVNLHIGKYAPSGLMGHEPKRARKLLLQKRQMLKIAQRMKEGGMTLVPLSVYFNDHGLAKVELGLVRGKKKYDRRREIKQREWQRSKEKLLRRRG